MRGVSLVWGALFGLALGACGKKEAPPAATTVKSPEATAEKPAEKPTEKPAEDPAAKPAEKPTEKPADDPAKKPAEDPSAKPVEKPAEDPVVKQPDDQPAVDPVAKKAEAPKPSDAKKPRKKLEKKDREAAGVARQAFRELLDAGRKAVKADDPTTGMQKLEEALSKVPGHPSALGELGWAAYRAGPAYFDKSLDATRRALAASKKPKQRGALWYNLGRVAEDQGNLALAISSYRESLANRPGNDAVQKRLEGLLAKVGGKDGGDGIAKLDDVCQALRDEQGCATAASAEGFVAHSCDCGSEILGPEEGFGRAALMRVTGTTEDVGGTVDATYLVIEVAAKWHVVTMVGNDWNPGMGYVSNTSTREAFEFRPVNGKPMLWVEFENSSDDLDPGVYTSSSDWSRTLTLCAFEGGAPTCVSVPLGNGSEVSKFSFDDEPVPEGEGPAEEKKERWAMAATLGETGEIVIEVVEGQDQLDESVKGLAGNWTFAKLVTAPGVVKHTL